jgi:hypothetical protein
MRASSGRLAHVRARRWAAGGEAWCRSVVRALIDLRVEPTGGPDGAAGGRASAATRSSADESENSQIPKNSQTSKIRDAVRPGTIEVGRFFLHPVSCEDFPDYKDVVERPMCLSAIEKRTQSRGRDGYESFEAFFADVRLVIDNALLYNADPVLGADTRTLAGWLSDCFEARRAALLERWAAEDAAEAGAGTRVRLARALLPPGCAPRRPGKHRPGSA